MTVISTPRLHPPTVQPVSAGRGPFHYSLERYHAAIEAGILTENDKVELIFGQLIDGMPIGKRHGDCVDLLSEFFVPRFASTHKCRAQNPITLLGHSEPEPDYAVVNKESYQERSGHPEAADIDLLIEVSDSTLEYDRTTKSALYALAGIREYWIINLKQNQIEVYLQPNTEDGTFDYLRKFSLGTNLESPFCGEILVDQLLPKEAL